MQPTISAIIIAKNEEKNIEECLKNLTFCDEVVIVDDNSTDKTATIAKRLGAKVFQHSLNNNFATQRDFGLSKAAGDWLLFVDADERVDAKLAKEIQNLIQSNVLENGFYIKRLDYMWGKVLVHGEAGDIYLLRLAKKNAGKWKGKVHETWSIKEPTGVLKNVLYHYPNPTISEFLEKINFYSSLRANELYDAQVKTSFWQIIAYPKAKFIQNYILRRGFMDGNAGFVFAMIMSFHSFLVRGKLWQLWETN